MDQLNNPLAIAIVILVINALLIYILYKKFTKKTEEVHTGTILGKEYEPSRRFYKTFPSLHPRGRPETLLAEDNADHVLMVLNNETGNVVRVYVTKARFDSYEILDTYNRDPEDSYVDHIRYRKE